jgi:hypothetical protein
MYSTPYVLLYNFRSKSLGVSKSSYLAIVSSDNSDDGAHMEKCSPLKRQRYGSKLNYELS